MAGEPRSLTRAAVDRCRPGLRRRATPRRPRSSSGWARSPLLDGGRSRPAARRLATGLLRREAGARPTAKSPPETRFLRRPRRGPRRSAHGRAGRRRLSGGRSRDGGRCGGLSGGACCGRGCIRAGGCGHLRCGGLPARRRSRRGRSFGHLRAGRLGRASGHLRSRGGAGSGRRSTGRGFGRSNGGGTARGGLPGGGHRDRRGLGGGRLAAGADGRRLAGLGAGRRCRRGAVSRLAAGRCCGQCRGRRWRLGRRRRFARWQLDRRVRHGRGGFGRRSERRRNGRLRRAAGQRSALRLRRRGRHVRRCGCGRHVVRCGRGRRPQRTGRCAPASAFPPEPPGAPSGLAADGSDWRGWWAASSLAQASEVLRQFERLGCPRSLAGRRPSRWVVGFGPGCRSPLAPGGSRRPKCWRRSSGEVSAAAAWGRREHPSAAAAAWERPGERSARRSVAAGRQGSRRRSAAATVSRSASEARTWRRLRPQRAPAVSVRVRWPA